MCDLSFALCELWDAALQQTGWLRDRKGALKKRKRSKKRVIFLSSIPMGIAARLFTRVATFHFLLCICVCLCVHVCPCIVCMCELCEGLAPLW